MTAGNASGINDGAAALVIATGKKAQRARTQAARADPVVLHDRRAIRRIMGMGPVEAMRKALERAG